MKAKITRRSFIKGIVGGVVLVSAMTGHARAAERPLKIATYGGIFKEVMDEVLVKPFVEETGIAVENKPFDVGEALLMLQRAVDVGEAPVDVPILGATDMMRGIEMGLDIWKTYHPGAIDNLKYIAPELIMKVEDKVIGVGALSWYLNLVYNTEVITEELDSWKVFWDPTYKNMCGLNRLPDDSYLLDVTAVTFFGGQEILETKEGVIEVLEKLVEVKPQVKLWWTTEAEFQGPLMDGEVPLGQLYNDITLVLEERGEPVRSVFPKEGGVLDHGVWAILKTTPMLAEAFLFIDYACRPDVQNRIALGLYTAPTLKTEFVELPPEIEFKIHGPGPGAAIHPKRQLYIGEMGTFVKENWDRMLFG